MMSSLSHVVSCHSSCHEHAFFSWSLSPVCQQLYRCVRCIPSSSAPQQLCCSPTQNSLCMCWCTQQVVYMACCCLLQAADAREFRSLPTMQSGPLGFTNPIFLTELHPAHPQQQQPQKTVLQPTDPGLLKLLHSGSAPLPPPPFPRPLPHNSLSSCQPILRTPSLSSNAS